MFSKYLVAFLIVSIFTIIDGEENDQFFRNDYKFIKGAESFYKIHTLPKTWNDAKVMCQMEGAYLFYPEDADEAQIVMSYWNETQPFITWVFIGVADWNTKEVFETIDGRLISDVYDAWSYGEPNNNGGEEGCVVMRKDDGNLNDDKCTKRFPFICKKSLATLQWNTLCDIPDQTYENHPLLDRCYKFHLTPKTWGDAYATCRAEQSYLAIINSEAEAAHLVNLTANAPKDDVKGNYLRGAVHLGFKYDDGWITTSGVPLHQSGYNVWGFAQPDGGENEKCGSMFYNGHLNDIGCFHKMFFICEHEAKVRNEEISLRFGAE